MNCAILLTADEMGSVIARKLDKFFNVSTLKKNTI